MLTKTRGSERFVFRSHPKIPQSLELWKRTQGGSREQKHRAAGLSRSGRLFSPRECQALGTVRTAGPAPWWAAMGPHTPAGLCAFLSTAFRRLRILRHHEGPVVPGSPRQSDFGLRFLRK